MGDLRKGAPAVDRKACHLKDGDNISISLEETRAAQDQVPISNKGVHLSGKFPPHAYLWTVLRRGVDPEPGEARIGRSRGLDGCLHLSHPILYGIVLLPMFHHDAEETLLYLVRNEVPDKPELHRGRVK